MAWLQRATNDNQREERYVGEKEEREVSQKRSKETRKGETLTARVFRSLWKSARLRSGFEMREKRRRRLLFKRKRGENPRVYYTGQKRRQKDNELWSKSS